MLKSKNNLTIFLAVIIVLMVSFGVTMATGGFSFFGIKPNIASSVNLVGNWSLNESDSSGIAIYDKSGNGNDGASANTPNFTKDQNDVSNQAMHFEQDNSDIINLGDSSDFKTAQFSFGGWFKAVKNSQHKGFISSLDSTSEHRKGYGFVMTSTDNVYFRTGNDGANFDAITLSNFQSDEWNFLVGTYDGTVKKLYHNGLLIGTQTVAMTHSDLSLYIGEYYADGSPTTITMDGDISDVFYYDSALSQEKVSQLYKSGQTSAGIKVDARNLLNEWDFTSGGWYGTGTTDITSNTFTTDGVGGMQILDAGVIEGRKYRFIIEGNTTTPASQVYAYNPTSIIVGGLTGTFTYNEIITGTGKGFYLRNSGSGTTTITRFEIVDITNKYSTGSLQKGLVFDMPFNENYTEAGSPITITNIDGDGTDATASATDHKLSVGDKVMISDSTNYNGTHTVKTVSDANTFTFATDQSTTGEAGIGKRLDGITKDRTPYGNDGIVNNMATLEYDGLVNAGDGVAYIPQDKAYGTWEFDTYLASGASGYLLSRFISDNNAGTSDRYTLNLYRADGTIKFYKDATPLFTTDTSYISTDTWYRFKIIRTSDHHFTVYIKGGAFGWDDWIIVSTAGGSGSNPTTSDDDDYPNSNYFVVNIDSGDKIRNLKIDGKSVKLSRAVQSSGTWTKTAPSYAFARTGSDYVNFNKEVINNLGTDDFTFSIWQKREVADRGEYVLGQYESTSKYFLYNLSPDDNRFRYELGADGGRQFYIKIRGNDLDDTNWHHVVFVVDRDNIGNWKAYVDGNEANDIDTYGSGTNSLNLDADLTVGIYRSSSYRFGGHLGGMKIWNRMLSVDEIDSLYNREKVNY